MRPSRSPERAFHFRQTKKIAMDRRRRWHCQGSGLGRAPIIADRNEKQTAYDWLARRAASSTLMR